MMWTRIVYSIVFKTLLVTLIFLIGVTATVHSQDGATGKVEISVESLETLIKILETQQERESLINELKALRESQRVQPRKEISPKEKVNLVDRFVLQYQKITDQTASFFRGISETTRRIPEGLNETMTYLSAPRNRAVLYRTAIIIGIGIATALVIIILVNRLTSMLSDRLLRRKRRKVFGRIYEAAVMMAVRITPYAAVFVASFLVLIILGIHGIPYRLAIMLFSALLLYETIFNVSRILLNPHDPEARVIRLADETSAYVWVWTRRFLNIWILYYVATKSLEILEAPPFLLAGISKILILLFPIFSTILLLQIRRMSAAVQGGHKRPTFWRRLWSYCARFWPLAAGITIWLIAIFTVADYQQGILFLMYASLKTLLVIPILWGLFYAVDFLFNRLFKVSEDISLRFPGLEEKTNRYIGTARGVIKGVVIVIGIGGILEFWGLRASWFIKSEMGSSILSRALTIAITLGIVMLIIDLSGFLTKRLVSARTDPSGTVIEPGRKKRTLVPLFHWLVNVAAVFVGAVIVLSQFGVNVTPILAGAGIVGLAVGFGAQSLVKDFITGLFLLFEDSVAVGDVVVINGTGGLVEAVTLRTVKMRDLAGNVHVVPNGSIDMITNMTKEYSRYVFEVGIAYREDVDEVTAVLKEIGESIQNDPEYQGDILEPLEILGVDRFDDSAVVIKARITTRPIKQWRVGREFNRRMKKMFDERNIEIPFPHRTVYWGEPKTGQAPPLEIKLKGQETV